MPILASTLILASRHPRPPAHDALLRFALLRAIRPAGPRRGARFRSVPYHPVVGLMGYPNWTCNASSRIPMHIATQDLVCVKCRCHIMGSTSCRRRTACNQPFWCVRHGARCKGLSSGGPQPCRGEKGGTARTVLQPRWREAKKLKLAPARREARTPHLPVPDAWVR